MIETKRLLLREFMEADYDDLYEFLSQLENDEFEGYPDITYENGIQKWKDTYVYAKLNSNNKNIKRQTDLSWKGQTEIA